MDQKENIIGCFASFMSGEKNVKLFNKYIWGENGVSFCMKKLNHYDYGTDILFILFKFYVNPIAYLEENLREIENYRKKEKSIGIPIIVTDENFFNKSETERCDFLKQSILKKIDILAKKINKKNFDTNIERLKKDVSDCLT